MPHDDDKYKAALAHRLDVLDQIVYHMWEHKKTGGRYVPTAINVMECDLSLVVTYRSADDLTSGGADWVRPLSDFLERFKLTS